MGGLSVGASTYLTVLAALPVALGVVWNPLTAAADRAAGTFETTGRTPGVSPEVARP